MRSAWLIYHREDYLKNKFFAEQLITYVKAEGIDLRLVLREDIVLGIAGGRLFAKDNKHEEAPKIVINRSRDSFLAKQLELMGIRVYNTYHVTHLCNDKSRTHQFAAALGMPSVDMLFGHKRLFDLDSFSLDYPVVLKNPSGHGGSEVFMCRSQEELELNLYQIKGDEYLIQQLCKSPGIDIRVFVMDNQIIGAIKRESETDFRSNYSLGGKAELYQLKKEERVYVQKIIEALPSDFIGIDFILGEKGEFLFNEIEDVVGSRTLYEYGNIDTAKAYAEHIKSTAT